MKTDEHTALVQDILNNVGDQAYVSEKLALLSSDYSEFSKQVEDNKKLTETTLQANEKLRQANLNLFMQIGEKPKPDVLTQTHVEEKELKIEDLLDGKGNFLTK